jgi:type IV secretion system protein VirD4
MNKTGNSLLMGRSLYNGSLIGLTDDTHMLTFAGARGGKGSTASIPNLLRWPHSAMVIDIKGTHAAVTSRYRREVLKQNVYMVDPFLVLGKGSDRLNPLSTLDPTAPDIREQISVIADALVVADPETKDKHWDDGSRTVFTGIIAHLISSPNYRNPSLKMIRDLLSMLPEQQNQLWADMSLNDKAGGAAKEAAARIIRGIDTNEILGILSSADKHSEWLSSEALKPVIAPDPALTSFSFAEMKEKPTTIYLVLPPHYLETHKRFLRLFINLAINQMSVGGRSKIPVLMIMDEFLACGYMSEVVKAFGLMAGYNLVLWPFIQDLGRLRDLYKNSVDSFIQNSRAVQVFAVSDETTTKYVSDRIGERSMRYVVGMKDSLRTPPLRTPTEVAKEISADSDYQYILRAGKAPLYLRKVRYYEDAQKWKPDAALPDWLMKRIYPFWGKYDHDPDFSNDETEE